MEIITVDYLLNLGICSTGSRARGFNLWGFFAKLSAPLVAKLYIGCEHVSKVQKRYGSPLLLTYGF